MSTSNKYHKYLAATIGTTLVASTVATVVPYNVVNAASSLSDLEQGSYYYEAVTNLIEQGIIAGFPDGTFKPYIGTTRGQAAVMIARALNLEGVEAVDPGFTDVHKLSYYYNAISALVDEGIVHGVSEDTFEPERIVTRAEMAKMIVNAFGLKENKDLTSVFTDIPANSWYSGYVKALLDNGVTNGVTATTFGPDQDVLRAQVATFIYRAQQVEADIDADIIEDVTDSSAVIDGQSYKIAENLKKIFNAKNAAVLENARIVFEQQNGTITGIRYLEITASGKAAAVGQPDQGGHLVLDGNNAVINGSVVINGDYVTVKNLTIKEDFTIGTGVQNSFLMDNLVVEGTTTVADNETHAASVTNDTSVKAAAAMKVKIIFTNSSLKIVQINKNDVAVESKGSTKLLEIKVASNANITADSTVEIPKITLQIGSQQVEINATVQELVIDSEDEITISGEANVEKVKISTSITVNLNTTGEIKKLESTNKDANITLSKDTKVENVVVPKGSDVSDIIGNYDEVKENIEQIGGVENPDYQEPTPPPAGGGGGGGGGGGSTDQTAPVVQSATYTIGGDVHSYLGNNTIDINVSESQIDDLSNISFNISENSNVTINATESIFGYNFDGSATLTPNNGSITYNLDLSPFKTFISTVGLLDNLSDAEDSVTLDVDHVKTLLGLVPSSTAPGASSPWVTSGDNIELNVDNFILLMTSNDLWDNVGTGGNMTLDVATVQSLFSRPDFWSVISGGSQTITLNLNSLEALQGVDLGYGTGSVSIPISLAPMLFGTTLWQQLDTDQDGKVTLPVATVQSLFTEILNNISYADGSVTVKKSIFDNHYTTIMEILDENVDGDITINSTTARAFLTNLNLDTNVFATQRTIDLRLTDAAGNYTDFDINIVITD